GVYNTIINNKAIAYYNIYGSSVSGTDKFGNNHYAKHTYGGLVGKTEDCSFFACYSKANVGYAGSTENNVAGLVANATSTTFDQCFMEGTRYGKAATLSNISNGGTHKDCYYRESGKITTTFYNETRVLGGLDPKIWVRINEKDCLKVFYWN
ncbi:MAG: hypothetical protein J6J24_00165, partial [Clostridia bacterium]|nr:hypothetical protein [Clostridia bacterium]